uniref:C2H2-type domain-containing protein n=1 Tax=Canis lupus familiaris TaxID=9615 RepID=A0A8C0S5F9_CANLF
GHRSKPTDLSQHAVTSLLRIFVLKQKAQIRPDLAPTLTLDPRAHQPLRYVCFGPSSQQGELRGETESGLHGRGVRRRWPEIRALGAGSAPSPGQSATCVRTACHSARRGRSLGDCPIRGGRGGAEARKPTVVNRTPALRGRCPEDEPIRRRGSERRPIRAQRPGAPSNQGGEGRAPAACPSLRCRPGARAHLPRAAAGVPSSSVSAARVAGTAPSGTRDDCCTQVKPCGSRTQLNILESELSSEEKIVRFTRNDSWALFGENQVFHNIGDQFQSQERCLRSHLLERVCESNEGNQGGDTVNQITGLTVHEDCPAGEKSCECAKCREVFRDGSFLENPQIFHPGHKPNPCEECGPTCSGVLSLSTQVDADLVRKPYEHQDIGRAPKRYSNSLGSQKSLECGKCGKTFTCPSSFQGHVQGHCEQRVHVCDVCGKTFMYQSYLTRHMRTHTGERPYECVECGKAYSCLSYFREHVKTHSGEKLYECKQCGKTFKYPASLQGHMMTHTGERPYLCQQCGKAFSCPKYFRRHVRTHSGVKPYECTLCGKAYSCSLSLREHVGTHSEERPYECKQCGKAFRHPRYFQRHVRMHTGVKPYECKECGKAYSSSTSLQEHVRTHTGERPFECQQCGKAFTRHSSLQGHVRAHSLEKRYECTQCGKAFRWSSSLQKHVRTHSEEKPYECQQCGKAFWYPANLRAHVKTHTEDRPYECPHCGKAFSCHSSLQVHVRKHNGVKPYECKECGKAFWYPVNLRAHVRTHTGERPYECQQCGKAYRCPANLRVHVRTHTGERPYECQQCGKAFRYPANLRAHVRTHTGERPYECQQCGKAFRYPTNLRAHVRTHTGEKL